MAWRKENEYVDEPRQGEVPELGVVLVVSPGWGRLRRGGLQEGSVVDGTTVICTLGEDASETIVRAPTTGVFVSWLVTDRDRVSPGTPIAMLGPAPSSE